jgi:hypothetical protein
MRILSAAQRFACGKKGSKETLVKNVNAYKSHCAYIWHHALDINSQSPNSQPNTQLQYFRKNSPPQGHISIARLLPRSRC